MTNWNECPITISPVDALRQILEHVDRLEESVIMWRDLAEKRGCLLERKKKRRKAKG